MAMGSPVPLRIAGLPGPLRLFALLVAFLQPGHVFVDAGLMNFLVGPPD